MQCWSRADTRALQANSSTSWQAKLGCWSSRWGQIRPFLTLQEPASPSNSSTRRPLQPPSSPLSSLSITYNQAAKMFLQRSAVALARRAAVAPALRRTLATTAVRRKFFMPLLSLTSPKIGCPSTRAKRAAAKTRNFPLGRPSSGNLAQLDDSTQRSATQRKDN